MKLFRVMCREEWDDLRTCSRFRTRDLRQMPVKWFALDLVDAFVWGRSFPGDPVVYYHVVEIEIDPALLRSDQFAANLDNVGDACYVELDQLDGVSSRLVLP